MDINENQFKLYFRIAKNLAFNLPQEKDRVKASKWIKKIEETTDASAERTKFHVMQLLLLSLQRKELVGPFEKLPKDDAKLTSYKWSFQPSDIARLILRKEFDRLGKPEVNIEMSGDLCEFVACQEIPNFGTHFFYAFSPEHITKWKNLDKDIIPKGFLNINVISSPDTSILRNSILESLNKKHREDSTPEYIEVKNKIQSNLYPPAIDLSCHIKDLKTPENTRHPQNDQVPLTTGHKLFNETRNAVELQDDRCARNKRSMIDKLPPHLKQRLTKKFVPAELSKYPDRNPDLARTPEIFRKDAHKIKYFRKYKPDEFLLSQNEKFRPAGEAFRDLQYMPPENVRRSPGKKYLPRSKDADKTLVQDLNESQNIKDSFDRSYKLMVEKRLQQQQHDRQPPVKRNALIERLEKLKASQAVKRIVFDDTDVDIETEEVAFNKFVWEELPEDDEYVTILDNAEMTYNDIFGDDQVCSIDVLPTPKPYQELEQAEILLDEEMQLDDIFGEDQIANPEAVFKDVLIEGEKIVNPKSGVPEKGNYRVGKRIMALPGEKPITQTYVEQSGNDKLFNESLLNSQNNTPPLNDSMINSILDEKLKKYKPGESSVPRTYGPWATKFKTDIEKLERGEYLEIEEPVNPRIVPPEDIDIEDSYSGIPQHLAEQSKRATKKFENLKSEYEKAQRKRQKRVVEQDLLEPYIYGFVPPELMGPLDTSIPENDKLIPPLMQKISVPVESKDLFESFEKQMDQSLKYFKEDSNQMTEICPGRNLLLDSDFLNKRIYGDLPAENSIMEDDEMNLDNFDTNESIPVQDLLQQQDIKRITSENISGMERILENVCSESSDEFSDYPIMPVDISPGQRLRRTLDIVNKYRMKRSQMLPPSYEIPYQAIENESFPSDSEYLDITPKSDLDIWDSLQMDEMEKRLDLLRQEAQAHQIPCHLSGPVEHNTPTREIVSRSNRATTDYKGLRKRYETFQAQQGNKNQQSFYSGTIKRPLPFLDKSISRNEIEEIDDLFNISERGKSDNVFDNSCEEYNTVLKQHIPAQNLADTSMPEADFVGDKVLRPAIAPVTQPYVETPCRGPNQVNVRRRLAYDESDTVCPQANREVSQNISRYETPRNPPGKRRLVYEMTANPEGSRLPVNISPRERIKLLIEQQPAVEVEVLPKKTEFSPLQFTTRTTPKKQQQIENESFPDECLSRDMSENLGDLAHALYIPTEAEEREIEEFHKSRRIVPTPPGFQTPLRQRTLPGSSPTTVHRNIAQGPCQASIQQKQNIRDTSPIGCTDILPGEENFKWLPNFVPFEEQVRAGPISRKRTCIVQTGTNNRNTQPCSRQIQPQIRTQGMQSQQQTQPSHSQRQCPPQARENQPQTQTRQCQSKAQPKQIQPRIQMNQMQPQAQTRQSYRQYPSHSQVRKNIPTSAKVDIICESEKDKEMIMRKSETVTKKPQLAKPKSKNPYMPRKKIESTTSGNIVEQPGETTQSTQTRRITSSAVGPHGRSLVEKSSMTVTKDFGKKSQKTVKANEITYDNAKERKTKEYTFATSK